MDISSKVVLSLGCWEIPALLWYLLCSTCCCCCTTVSPTGCRGVSSLDSSFPDLGVSSIVSHTFFSLTACSIFHSFLNMSSPRCCPPSWLRCSAMPHSGSAVWNPLCLAQGRPSLSSLRPFLQPSLPAAKHPVHVQKFMELI